MRSNKQVVEIYEELFDDLEALARSLERHRQAGEPKVWVVARGNPQTGDLTVEHLTEVKRA